MACLPHHLPENHIPKVVGQFLYDHCRKQQARVHLVRNQENLFLEQEAAWQVRDVHPHNAISNRLSTYVWMSTPRSRRKHTTSLWLCLVASIKPQSVSTSFINSVTKPKFPSLHASINKFCILILICLCQPNSTKKCDGNARKFYFSDKCLILASSQSASFLNDGRRIGGKVP